MWPSLLRIVKGNLNIRYRFELFLTLKFIFKSDFVHGNRFNEPISIDIYF